MKKNLILMFLLTFSTYIPFSHSRPNPDDQKRIECNNDIEAIEYKQGSGNEHSTIEVKFKQNGGNGLLDYSFEGKAVDDDGHVTLRVMANYVFSRNAEVFLSSDYKDAPTDTTKYLAGERSKSKTMNSILPLPQSQMALVTHSLAILLDYFEREKLYDQQKEGYLKSVNDQHNKMVKDYMDVVRTVLSKSKNKDFKGYTYEDLKIILSSQEFLTEQGVLQFGYRFLSEKPIERGCLASPDQVNHELGKHIGGENEAIKSACLTRCARPKTLMNPLGAPFNPFSFLRGREIDVPPSFGICSSSCKNYVTNLKFLEDNSSLNNSGNNPNQAGKQ